jgi:hypothetical protein
VSVFAREEGRLGWSRTRPGVGGRRLILTSKRKWLQIGNRTGSTNQDQITTEKRYRVQRTGSSQKRRRKSDPKPVRDDSADCLRISVAERRNRTGRKAGQHHPTDRWEKSTGTLVTQQSAQGSASQGEGTSQAGDRPTVQPVGVGDQPRGDEQASGWLCMLLF